MIQHALCTPKALVQNANKPRPPKTEPEEGWDSAFFSETDLKKSELGIKEISSTFHSQQKRREKGGRERRKEKRGRERKEGGRMPHKSTLDLSMETLGINLQAGLFIFMTKFWFAICISFLPFTRVFKCYSPQHLYSQIEKKSIYLVIQTRPCLKPVVTSWPQTCNPSASVGIILLFFYIYI